MQIMSSYVSMLNSEWSKDTENKKHAIAAETCQWLQQTVVQAWRKTGLPYHHSRVVGQELVEADMVRQIIFHHSYVKSDPKCCSL